MQSNNLYIALFSGCGGIYLEFHNSGSHGLFAMKKISGAFKTIEYNLKNKKKDFKWSEWLPQNSHDISFVFTTYKENLKCFPDSYKFQGKYILPEESAGHENFRDMLKSKIWYHRYLLNKQGLILNKMLHA